MTSFPSRRRGFTLVEILVALAIFGFLAAAVVLNFASLGRGVAFDEGVSRFETALRMARAEAANRGRRVRVTARVDGGGDMGVEWEPQPLTEPGKFADFAAGPGATWASYLPADALRVTRFEPRGSASPLGAPGGGAGLTFEPDGSGDSGVFELASRREDDPRRVEVEVNGVTGEIATRRVKTEDEQ